MQTYPVRPGHAAKTDLKMLFEAAFDSCTEKGGWLTGKFGTLLDIKVKYEGKKEFVVDTVTDKTVAVHLWRNIFRRVHGHTEIPPGDWLRRTVSLMGSPSTLRVVRAI